MPCRVYHRLTTSFPPVRNGAATLLVVLAVAACGAAGRRDMLWIMLLLVVGFVIALCSAFGIRIHLMVVPPFIF